LQVHCPGEAFLWKGKSLFTRMIVDFSARDSPDILFER